MEKYFLALLYFIASLFCIDQAEGQINNLEYINKNFSSIEDSLFYLVDIEGCGVNQNFNLLTDKLSKAYLLKKIKSENEAEICKALLLLTQVKERGIAKEVSKILNFENEGLVRPAIHTLTNMDSIFVLPYLQGALLNRTYKDKETYLMLIYALRDIPDVSSLPVLDSFLMEEKRESLRYPSVKKLVHKNLTLLERYFSGNQERVKCIESAINEIEHFNWALRMIAKDENPLLFIDVLKRSKYKDSFEVLLLREEIGGTSFSGEQKELLKSYHDNKTKLESLNH